MERLIRVYFFNCGFIKARAILMLFVKNHETDVAIIPTSRSTMKISTPDISLGFPVYVAKRL
jgi:hypothetical protein